MPCLAFITFSASKTRNENFCAERNGCFRNAKKDYFDHSKVYDNDYDYRLLSRCAMTVTSFGLLGLGRCSFTVLLPFKRYPPCFCPPWPPPPWPPPPVPVIPCWWCWWPGTKFSFRSRFSTFLLTKAEIGRKIVFDVAVQNVFLAPVVKKGRDLKRRKRLLLDILRDRLYVKWVCCWCYLLVSGVGLTNARCSTNVTRVRSNCSNVCDSWQMWFTARWLDTGRA